jgi:hypothetical protein
MPRQDIYEDLSEPIYRHLNYDAYKEIANGLFDCTVAFETYRDRVTEDSDFCSPDDYSEIEVKLQILLEDCITAINSLTALEENKNFIYNLVRLPVNEDFLFPPQAYLCHRIPKKIEKYIDLKRQIILVCEEVFEYSGAFDIFETA